MRRSNSFVGFTGMNEMTGLTGMLGLTAVIGRVGIAAVAVMVGLIGCGGSANELVPDDSCTYVRHRGLCEAQVTIDPREAESPEESTTLEVRWTWTGETPREVPRRTTRWYLTAREAARLGQAIDELSKSPCIVEEAVRPAECVGRLRILSVEAAP